MSLTKEAFAVRYVGHLNGNLTGDFKPYCLEPRRLITPDVAGTTIDVYKTTGEFRPFSLFNRDPYDPGELYLPPNKAAVAAVYPDSSPSKTDELVRLLGPSPDFFSVTYLRNTQDQRVVLYLAVYWEHFILDWYAINHLGRDPRLRHLYT